MLKKKFLIVEDEYINRQLLLSILSEYGDCDLAINGSDAVEMFEASFYAGSAYDLVCLDVLLPGMNGHNVLQHIREFEEKMNVKEHRKAKIVMITGIDDSASVKISMKYKANKYIKKPVRKNILLGIIKSLDLLGE